MHRIFPVIFAPLLYLRRHPHVRPCLTIASSFSCFLSFFFFFQRIPNTLRSTVFCTSVENLKITVKFITGGGPTMSPKVVFTDPFFSETSLSSSLVSRLLSLIRKTSDPPQTYARITPVGRFAIQTHAASLVSSFIISWFIAGASDLTNVI